MLATCMTRYAGLPPIGPGDARAAAASALTDSRRQPSRVACHYPRHNGRS